MKRYKLRYMPLHFKLLCYFLLFGAIILLVLWVFQTFFLKSFYTMSKAKTVESNASIVSKSIQENKNVQETIENIASYNNLSVYVYDSTSIFDLKYDCEYDNPATALKFEYHDIYNYYKEASENGGQYLIITNKTDTNNYREKLDNALGDFASNDSAENNRFINHNNRSKDDSAQIMIYADIIELDDNSECFLIITSSISPVNNTVEIIKGQMFIVSIAFILLSIVFSVYASQRIAKPISKTNNSAKELAKKNYDINFDATGYLEVEELNNTLNYAKTELAATEKLQRELIANISHDLRTPLTMITGYGEVMRDLPGENTPENIQIIIDEATRLSSLVNDLLDLSKLQSGAIQPEKKDFCLTDSIKNIFERYAKLKEQDGYNITFESSEDVYVNADELKISQVIYNLVNNAINHAGDDKTVIVTQTVKDKKVLIEVEDHGEGIPADKLEYIWDRYYKVDKEHKRGVIGTGLGLSIVKTILDSHNAHYGVKSRYGKGSTFWFELDTVTVKKKKSKNKNKD